MDRQGSQALVATIGGCLSYCLSLRGAFNVNTMETITIRSSKDEIISNACEAFDCQASQIDRLKSERTLLLWLVGCIAAIELMIR